MSIQTEINRITANVSAAYAAVAEKGGALPEEQNSANLASAISGIPSGGGGDADAYQNTRPADWLPIPEPQDDEMYLLFHIPDGVSSLLAFTVTCTGSYTVATGTVENGAFVQSGTVSIASGQKYEAELFADDFGDLTSTGMKQCMVKVSGVDILTWEPSTHSKKTSSSNFSVWNIIEISCRLPSGTKVACGNSIPSNALRKIHYFSWYGGNNITSMNHMFNNCNSLVTILQLDTTNVTSMSYMFNNCYSLISIPQLDTTNVTSMSYMFNNCYSLISIPQLDTTNVTNMSNMFSACNSLVTIPQLDTTNVTSMNYMFTSCNSLISIPQLDTTNVTNMSYMFNACYSLISIPQLSTAKVTNMSYMFNNCYSLVTIPQLSTAKVTNMSGMFNACNSIEKFTLTPTVTGWAGYAINLSNCSFGHQALVDLFNSLPTITSPKTLTLTGNPGVSELTDEEKAIATGKNWTLTL